MANTTTPPRTHKGTWVAVCLVAIGLVAGVVVVSYERFYEKELAKTGYFDRDAAEAEYLKLDERVSSAIEIQVAHRVYDDVLQFVQKYDRFAPAYSMMGRVLLGMERFDEAYEYIDHGLGLDDGDSDSHVLAGTICTKLGRGAEAERHYDRAVDLKPGSIDHRLHRAQFCIDHARHDEARGELLLILQLDSTTHKAYAMLADIFMQQNKLTLAMNQIHKAIDHTGVLTRADQAIYLRRKAAILRRQNKADEALQVLDQFSDEERIDLAVLHEIALCYSQQGSFDLAAVQFEMAGREQPGEWRFAAEAARWWIKAGEPVKAGLAIERIRSIDPRLEVIDKLTAAMKQSQSNADGR